MKTITRSAIPRMVLTDQQQAIIECAYDMKINACAGSGKTTTLVEYAATRPAGSRILYLAFNRSVKLEAESRFARRGLSSVTVQTAHSLAYRYIMRSGTYTLTPSGEHSVQDIVALFSMTSRHGPRKGQILAAHIRKLLAYYCNSSQATIDALDYGSTIDPSDKRAVQVVAKNHRVIYALARDLYQRQKEGQIGVTHDFYLKEFQLKMPLLPFDYILFDEGQDASPAMLSVFLAQTAVKVIVGDQHQQIYGFRYAVNALQQTDFAPLALTTSFRFDGRIAGLADYVLDWKKRIDPQYQSAPMTGAGVYTLPAAPIRAAIGRTNLTVLGEAINQLCVEKSIGSVYFEGRFDTYTFMESGGSLFDILHLFMGRMNQVRNPLIRSLGSLESLKEYIDATGEGSMRLALEIVRNYGDALPGFIQQIRAAHVADSERSTHADAIYSTVHRCKGLEYDSVTIMDDFINEGKAEYDTG